MLRAIAPVMLAGLMLCGCGGGGGGGGGGSGGGGGGTNGTFSVSPSSLTFAAPSTGGSTIGPQLITGTVSGVSASTLFLNVRVTGNAVAGVDNITITGSNSGTASVQPVSQHLTGPGTFTSTITVTACTSSPDCTSGVIGSPQTVNVTYTVTGVRSSVAGLSFGAYGDRPAAGDFERTFSVTGHPAQDWTATSSVPWLALTPSGGNAGASTTVAASLVGTQVESLANGAYSGTITLAPASGEPVTIPIDVNVSRVRVDYVAPYVAQAGVSGSVIIRGENLTRYPATGLRFGSDAAESFNVVSNTEIHAVHPPLTPGRYDVHLLNAEGIDNTRAALVVVEPTVYASAVLDYPEGGNRFPRCLAYDAERRSLIMGVQFNDATMNVIQLLRYSHESDWGAPTTATLPSPGSCALATDGTRIIAGFSAPGAGTFTVAELDPVTLEQLGQRADPRALSLDARSLALANDGRAIFVTEFFREGDVKAYWPLRPEITDFRVGTNHPIRTYDGQIGGSGDGSLILLGSWHGAGSRPVYRYDSSTRQLATTALTAASIEGFALDRTGSRVIINNRTVYDRDLVAIGTLPESTLVAALAPTSSHAYTYDSDGTIRTFDVAAAANGSFPEPVPPRTLTDAPGTGMQHRMLVTPDGQALFLTGNQHIVLVPL